MDKSDILVTPASQADPESRSVAMRSFGSSWSPRPILAQFLVVLVVVVPFLLAHVVTRELASNWHRPNSLTQLLVLWLVLAAVAVVIMEASLRVTRSLLPLSSLLRMNLAFPRSVPSRFRLALRTGNRSKLRDDLARRSSDTDEAEAYVAMLDLVEELNSHDRATRGHSERVRAYTDLLVRELGLDADGQHRLRWAALLHDIGKLRVSPAILNKRSSLTDEEFEEIKDHPLAGLELASPLAPWLGEDLLGVSDHHERWEGGGYPTGVSGHDIARAGRIIAVVDAFDVMTTVRSYKKAVPVHEAREELRRCAGTHFDPEIVRAFLNIPTRRLHLVVGPLAFASPLSEVRRRKPTLARRLAVGTAAGVVATASALAAPPATDDAAPEAATGPHANPPAVSAGAADAAEVHGDRVTADSGIRMGSTDGVPVGAGPDDTRAAPEPGRAPARPGQATDATPAPARSPVSGDQPERRPPGGSGDDRRPGPGDPGEPVAVVVDPAGRGVAVDGLTSLPVEIDLGDIGASICAAVGLCRPIVVETPIVLPV